MHAADLPSDIAVYTGAVDLFTLFECIFTFPEQFPMSNHVNCTVGSRERTITVFSSIELNVPLLMATHLAIHAHTNCPSYAAQQTDLQAPSRPAEVTSAQCYSSRPHDVTVFSRRHICVRPQQSGHRSQRCHVTITSRVGGKSARDRTFMLFERCQGYVVLLAVIAVDKETPDCSFTQFQRT